MAIPQSLLTPSFPHRALVQALALVLGFPSVFIHAQNTTAECSEDYDWVMDPSHKLRIFSETFA